MLKEKLQIGHSFLVEMLYLFTLVIYIELSQGTLGFMDLGLYLLIFGGWLLLSYRFAEGNQLRNIYFIAPIAGLIMYFLDFSLISIGLTVGYGAYRLERQHHSFSRALGQGVVLLVMSVMVFMNYQGRMTNYSPANFDLWIFLATTLVALIGSYLIDGYQGQGNLSYKTRSLAKILLPMLILAVVFPFAFRYFTLGIRWILSNISDDSLPNIEYDFDRYGNLTTEIELPTEESSITTGENFEYGQNSGDTVQQILAMIMVIIAVFLIYRFWRYLRDRGFLQVEQSATSTNTQAITESGHKRRRQPRSVPSHQVRKEYYRFEKYVAKQGKGRYYDETIDEWMDRLRLKDTLEPGMIDAYRKFRYNDQDLTPTEYQEFKSILKLMRRHLKK